MCGVDRDAGRSATSMHQCQLLIKFVILVHYLHVALPGLYSGNIEDSGMIDRI